MIRYLLGYSQLILGVVNNSSEASQDEIFSTSATHYPVEMVESHLSNVTRILQDAYL